MIAAPGEAVSAFAIASSTWGLAPRASGGGASRCLRSRTSASGSSNRSRTTVPASSAVMPPTGTPEIVTPGAINVGSGVVVVVPVDVVPVVVAKKPAAPTPPARTTDVSAPAAAQASAKTA